MKKCFNSNQGIKIRGVSQVCMGEHIAFISGQISSDPLTGQAIPGPVAEQTERAILAIKSIVEEMGLTLNNIVKCNVFISSMAVFEEMNEVYIKYFGTDNPPARQTVAAAIWGDLDVEISAEAIF